MAPYPCAVFQIDVVSQTRSNRFSQSYRDTDRTYHSRKGGPAQNKGVREVIIAVGRKVHTSHTLGVIQTRNPNEKRKEHGYKEKPDHGSYNDRDEGLLENPKKEVDDSVGKCKVVEIRVFWQRHINTL
jgi:hypothetical protein